MKKKVFFFRFPSMTNRITRRFTSMKNRRITPHSLLNNLRAVRRNRLEHRNDVAEARSQALQAFSTGIFEKGTAQEVLPADGFVPVDLSAASHSAVIVDVRVEFPDLQNTTEYGLVIPRGQCEGNSPHVAALYREAKELVRRLNDKMGRNAEMVARVLAHVAGKPVAILG